MDSHNPHLEPDTPYVIERAILPIEKFTLSERIAIGFCCGIAVGLILWGIAEKLSS